MSYKTPENALKSNQIYSVAAAAAVSQPGHQQNIFIHGPLPAPGAGSGAGDSEVMACVKSS